MAKCLYLKGSVQSHKGPSAPSYALPSFLNASRLIQLHPPAPDFQIQPPEYHLSQLTPISSTCGGAKLRRQLKAKVDFKFEMNVICNGYAPESERLPPLPASLGQACYQCYTEESRETELLTCGNCKRIAYCSPECQKVCIRRYLREG